MLRVDNSGLQQPLDLQQSQNEELVRRHLPQQVIDLLKPHLGNSIRSWKILSLSREQFPPTKRWRDGLHLVHPHGVDDLAILLVDEDGAVTRTYYGKLMKDDNLEGFAIELGKMPKRCCVVL